MGWLLFSCGSWCVQDFVCALQDWSLFLLILWKSYNQIPLAFKVKFPGDSQPLFGILRLGSLMWGLEPSQQWENFFGIIILQFCGSPTWLVWDLILLWLCPSYCLTVASLLSLVMGSFFGGFLSPPVNGWSTASCNFGALARGDNHMTFYSAIFSIL